MYYFGQCSNQFPPLPQSFDKWFNILVWYSLCQDDYDWSNSSYVREPHVKGTFGGHWNEFWSDFQVYIPLSINAKGVSDSGGYSSFDQDGHRCGCFLDCPVLNWPFPLFKLRYFRQFSLQVHFFVAVFIFLPCVVINSFSLFRFCEREHSQCCSLPESKQL